MFRRKIAAGMEPGEARRRAQLEFAGIEQIKEDCRDVRGRWLKIWGRISATRREHGDFQLDQCGDVAAASGKDPGRLVQITRIMPNGKPGMLSYPHYQDFRDNLKSISSATILI